MGPTFPGLLGPELPGENTRLFAGTERATGRRPEPAELRRRDRAPLYTSGIDPRRLTLWQGVSQIACPTCGRWRPIEGLKPGWVVGDGRVGQHYGDDQLTCCPDSGQQVVVDETSQQWHQRLVEAQVDAARIAPVLKRQQQRLRSEISRHRAAAQARQQVLASR